MSNISNLASSIYTANSLSNVILVRPVQTGYEAQNGEALEEGFFLTTKARTTSD